MLILLVLLACSNYSFSQSIKPEANAKQTPLFRLLIKGLFEFGGDEVAKVYFTNGNDQSVKAGQGGSILIGTQFQVPNVKRLLLRGAFGIKYVTTAADNAHIRLTRIPIHVTATWMATEKIGISAGLAMHRNIRFNAGGLGPNMDFKGASGPVFEFSYGPVGLSYTAMKYTDEKNFRYSANAIGLSLTGVIPTYKKYKLFR